MRAVYDAIKGCAVGHEAHAMPVRRPLRGEVDACNQATRGIAHKIGSWYQASIRVLEDSVELAWRKLRRNEPCPQPLGPLALAVLLGVVRLTPIVHNEPCGPQHSLHVRIAMHAKPVVYVRRQTVCKTLLPRQGRPTLTTRGDKVRDGLVLGCVRVQVVEHEALLWAGSPIEADERHDVVKVGIVLCLHVQAKCHRLTSGNARPHPVQERRVLRPRLCPVFPLRNIEVEFGHDVDCRTAAATSMRGAVSKENLVLATVATGLTAHAILRDVIAKVESRRLDRH